eukprot:SAG31_NODE_3116_length_4658_cov_2.625576_6_plen_84_part_00
MGCVFVLTERVEHRAVEIAVGAAHLASDWEHLVVRDRADVAHRGVPGSRKPCRRIGLAKQCRGQGAPSGLPKVGGVDDRSDSA